MKVRVFDTIAKGYSAISMPDLISYLERNSFYPRREDIEAILRRCDHDANRQISYSEFCELASIDEASAANASPEDQKAASASKDEAKNDEEPASPKEDGAAVADSGDAEDGGFNDRVEDVDAADDNLRRPPTEEEDSKQRSAQKNQSSAKRRRNAAEDNLTPAQRQQKRDQEARIAEA